MVTCAIPKSMISFAKALKATMGRMTVEARHFMVEGKDGSLTITAADGNRTLTVSIPAEGTLAPTLVPGEGFLKGLKGAKRFTLKDGAMETDLGTSSLAFRDIADFPARAHATTGGIDLEITKDALNYVWAAASADLTKPTLSGVLVDLTKKGVYRLVGTDGFRMAVAESKARKNHDLMVILPADTLPVLAALPLGNVSLEKGKTTFTLRGEGWAYTALPTMGNYPSYEKVFPADGTLDKVFTFDRAAFLAGVKMASKPADDYNRNLSLYLADGQAGLEFVHPDGPRGAAMVDYKGKAEPMALSFNHAYLEDLLSNGIGKVTTLRCRDEVATVVFDGGESGPWGLKTISMPVRFASSKGTMTDPDVVRDEMNRVAVASRGVRFASDGCTCTRSVGLLGKMIGLTSSKSNGSCPVLRNVRFEAAHSALRASMAADLDVFLTVDVPAEGTQSPVLVEGDALRSIFKGATSFTLSDGRILAAGGELPTTSAESFPEAPAMVDGRNKVAQVTFSKASLAFAASCVSRDVTRRALSSVLLDLDEAGEVRLVSTDGNRLAVARFSSAPEAKGTHLLPVSVFPVLTALVDAGISTFEIHADATHVAFKAPGISLAARRLEANYPAYRAVVPGPERLPYSLTVGDRAAFRKAMGVVIAKTDPYNNNVTMSASGTVGTLVVDNPDSGRAEVPFACTVSGPGFMGLSFAAPLLKDLADKIQGTGITFHYGEKGAVWMVDGQGEDADLKHYMLPGYKNAEFEDAPEASELPAPAPEVEVEPDVLPEGAIELEAFTVEVEVPAPAPEPVAAIEEPAVAPEPVVPQAPEIQDGDTYLVWRQDAKAVRALGGRDAIKAARYRVLWEVRQSKGFTSYVPQAWYVPRTVLAEKEITPISKAEAYAIARDLSEKAKARIRSANPAA